MKQRDKTTSNRLTDRITDRIAERFRMRGRTRMAPPSANHPPTRRRDRFYRTMAYALPLFSMACMVTVLNPTASSFVIAATDAVQADHVRGLTMGEASFARAVFGADFKTDNIELHFHNGAPYNPLADRLGSGVAENSMAYVRGTTPNRVQIVYPGVHADDYSHSYGYDEGGGVFIHELVHTWQFRNKIVSPACVVSDNVLDQYAFKLTPQSKFQDFCEEQQASIVQAYVERFILPGKNAMNLEAKAFMHSYIAQLASGSPQRTNFVHSEHDRNLMRVVESVLPHAAAARLRMQDNYNNAARCTVDRQMAQPDVSTYLHEQACEAMHLRTIAGEQLHQLPDYIPTPDVPPPAPAPSDIAKPAQIAAAKPKSGPRL